MLKYKGCWLQKRRNRNQHLCRQYVSSPKSATNIDVAEPSLGWATSMLVTNVEDEMCWRRFEDVGDTFGHFGYQHPISLNINIRHQFPKDVTKILILSQLF